MRRALLFVVLLLILPGPSRADFYMKTKITTSGIAGLGGTEGKTESWISGKRQVEMTKIEVTSPLMKPFMDGVETYTITDLETGVITHVDKSNKTYTEYSIADMKAQIEAARAEAREAYGKAKNDAENPMPTVQGGDIRVETQATGEKQKIAGLECERTKLLVRSTGKDENGEEVTFKVLYDAWLTPEVPGEAERKAFVDAYSEALEINLVDQVTEENLGLHTALTSSGISPQELAPHLGALQGFPAKLTVHLGTELTEEQRQSMAEAMKEESKPKKKSGFSLGGLTKKLEETVSDKITDAMVNEFFGAGVSVDEDGDPIFFSMTSELEKVSTKSDPKKFNIPDNYEKVTP